MVTITARRLGAVLVGVLLLPLGLLTLVLAVASIKWALLMSGGQTLYLQGIAVIGLFFVVGWLLTWNWKLVRFLWRR